ncbi:MADS-box transcription factor [Medicago truncatula]|uniref:MADS-box transcription factor n=1 Tax=Medicago truncatula TaxID=3880 RepID=G7JU20_MEDTR|nr:MADS-box transcription factor [Medicago truncatula]
MIEDFWQREAASLRQQLQHLNDSQRQLMGQELSGLDLNELQHLESQLEMSLKSIRTRKGLIFSDEINELLKKGSLSSQENEDLHKKIDLIGEKNAELEKVIGVRRREYATSNASHSTISYGHDMHDESISLQLRQPQPRQ